jgi:hypothetical protein
LQGNVELKGAIALEDTDYGWLAHQRQHECMASGADMSAEQIAALEQTIAATKGRGSQHWLIVEWNIDFVLVSSWQQFLPATCLFSWLVALDVLKHFLGCQRRKFCILTSFVPWELVATSMRIMVGCCVGFAHHDSHDGSVTVGDTSIQKYLQ